MSKHAELGPEPTVNMGDHAAAQKRADEIGAFLRSTAYQGKITRNERTNLRHLRAKWLKRASGYDWFFEHFGNEPRAYTLLEFKIEGGLHRMRRHRNYEGLPNLADPEPDEIPHRSSSKIRYDDPERTGFEEPEDVSYAGLRGKSGRVKNRGGERTPFDSLYEEHGDTPE